MPLLAPSEAVSRIAAVEREIDQARQRGPLQQIVVPPCPELLTRLQRAMAPVEPDLNEVGRIANADVAMSATLIRNANGALFANGQPVTSVGQAMTRLGLHQTAAIMTGFLARHALPVRSPQLQGFWERSTQRALAMACLAGHLPGLSADLAYSFGLFSHVGLPVLMQSVRGYAGTMVEAQARKDRPFIATENANHRTDHAVVGALTTRAWRFAPAVVAAIRLHHSLESLGGGDIEPEVQTLMALGLVADHLVQRHEGQGADADWLAYGANALGWLQASDDDLLHWGDQVQVLFDDA
jgi:HD-like signal output (HDOD) protein